MTHKIIPYILPIATILTLILAAIIAGPRITGFFIINQQNILNAEIKITAQDILPENAVLHIYLERDNQIIEKILTTSISNFINQYPAAQRVLEYKYGKNSQIGYEGYGYVGSYVFNIHDLNIDLGAGTYLLKTKIIWQDKTISETEQEVRI